MIGAGTIGQYAIGQIPGSLDLSEGGFFQSLLQDTEAQFIYLVEISGYDNMQANEVRGPAPISVNPIGVLGFEYRGGIAKTYVSDLGFYTTGNDDPANTTYLPLTSNPFQFDASIMSGDEFRGSLPSFGAVRILNGDAEMDALADYYLGGREIKVLIGGKDFARNQFETAFNGVMTQPEFTEDEVIINIADRSRVLETEFLQNIYAGTGGLEGGDDIQGNPKPLSYGQCHNVEAVQVDQASLIYQVHDGSIEQIIDVFDKGISLVNGGDVSDIQSANVAPGQYITQLSGGYFKLGSSPAGRITCDVKGDNVNGYFDDAPAIVKRLVETRMGANSFDQSDIEGGSFNELSTTISASCGMFIDRRRDLKAILDDLLIPLQAYWTFNRQGLLTVGLIDAPEDPVFTITDDNIEDGSFEVIRTIPPAWRITLGYDRSWTLQTGDDMAAGATAARRAFTKDDYRKIKFERRNTRALTASAREVEFDTPAVNQSDIENEIERFERIYGVKRQVIKVRALNLLFRVFLGDSICLKTNRFGLNAGKNFIVTSISEDAETQSTDLELWG